MTYRTLWPPVAGVLLLVSFLVVGLSVREQPVPLDVAATGALIELHRDTAGDIVEPLSDVLGLWLAGALAVAMVVALVVLWRRGDRERASLVLRIGVVYALCRLTSFVAKPLFDRDRPREDYPDLSYPSGHVVAAASMAFAAVLLCVHLAPRLTRRVLAAVVLVTVVTAFCRVALAVHWVTDTIGAVLAVSGVGLLAAAALRLIPVARDPAPAAAGEA